MSQYVNQYAHQRRLWLVNIAEVLQRGKRAMPRACVSTQACRMAETGNDEKNSTKQTKIDK
jgi:hypothetical protein